MDFEWLKQILKDEGFSVNIIPGRYNAPWIVAKEEHQGGPQRYDSTVGATRHVPFAILHRVCRFSQTKRRTER